MNRRFPATPLTNTSGVPSEALVALLNLTDIRVPHDMEAINQAVQQLWLKPGLQAAQITEEHAHLAEQATPLFRALGLNGTRAIQPGMRQWSIQLGSLYTGLHRRFAHAVGIRNSGVRWTNYGLLTSHRPRQIDGKETDDIIVKPVDGGLPFFPGWTRPDDLPSTEAELAKLMLDQVGHHRQWEKSREHLVVADDRDGKPANTVGTLEAFAAQCDPRGDSLLVISSQPHMLRQCLEAAKVLGDRFNTYEVTGYDMPETQNVTKKFDELAKLINLLVTT